MPQPYLVPKKASQSHDTTSTAAQAEQAQEHDEDQANVGSERNDGTKFDTVHADHHAGPCSGYPSSAELQMGQPCGFEMADKDHSPGRYLITKSIRIVLSTVYRRDLPWMRKDTLITHMLAVMATITLSLFQIATLMATECLLRESCRGENVRAKNNQQRCGGKGQVCHGLEERVQELIRVPSLKRDSIGWRAHDLEKNQDLGNMPVARQ